MAKIKSLSLWIVCFIAVFFVWQLVEKGGVNYPIWREVLLEELGIKLRVQSDYSVVKTQGHNVLYLVPSRSIEDNKGSSNEISIAILPTNKVGEFPAFPSNKLVETIAGDRSLGGGASVSWVIIRKETGGRLIGYFFSTRLVVRVEQGLCPNGDLDRCEVNFARLVGSFEELNP